MRCTCGLWPILTTTAGASSVRGREAARSGKREIILALLEVLDGFYRAVQQTTEAPSSVSEGVQILHRKLLSLLEAQGVTPFQSVGQAFSPELHEAIGSIQSHQVESGIVDG